MSVPLVQDRPVAAGPVPGTPAAPHRRVLFLTHTGQVGGAEVCLLALAPRFGGDVLAFQPGPLADRLRALDVRLVAPDRPLDLSRVRRHGSLLQVRRKALGVARLVRQIGREARERDLVYCNSQKAFVLGALARPLHRRPLLWHLHDILDHRHFGRTQIRLVVRLAGRFADEVVVPSQAVAEAFVAAGGPRRLVRVIANGVVAPPPPGERDELLPRRALGERLGLPPGPLVGVFSRLAAWKGQHVLLEALVGLPGVACLVAGAPLFGEEAYAERLVSLSQRLGVQNRLRFLGHRDDVHWLMRAVDVVVHPSVAAEPFGLTLVEAMLAGTPLVASSGGAADEILERGRLGGQAPPGDAAGLARAVGWCLENPQAAAARARLAQRQAQARYGAGRFADEIAAAVERHAGRGRA